MFSKQLRQKIEYSIDLLRKCEDMALRMDAENGYLRRGGKIRY